MKGRRANAVFFGLDFQVNAAIVLMLENIKELESIKLEGNYEDIALKMDDDSYILAQAKAVVNSSTDFSHVRGNLKKAIRSLSEGAQKANIRKLIFITNSPNPFNDDSTRSLFWGPTRRDYNSLPEVAQKLIDGYLQSEEIDTPLNPQDFSIHYFPFETDDDSERYKAVKQCIDDFVGRLNINVPGIGDKLLTIWHWDIFLNGDKKDPTIFLTKKKIIWPALVITTSIDQCDEAFLSQFDVALYDEIVSRYHDTIDNCCERIDFFSKILFDYQRYQFSGKGSEKIVSFVDSQWEQYVPEFDVDSIDPDVQEALIKIIVYNILRRRYAIEKIKKGVKL